MCIRDRSTPIEPAVCVPLPWIPSPSGPAVEMSPVPYSPLFETLIPEENESPLLLTMSMGPEVLLVPPTEVAPSITWPVVKVF